MAMVMEAIYKRLKGKINALVTMLMHWSFSGVRLPSNL